MKSFFWAVLVFFVLFLSACFNQGQSAIIDQDRVSQLKPGISNFQQVMDLFGEPAMRMKSNSGEEEWEYFFSKNLTAFSGQYHALKLQFDRSGILKTYSSGRIR